MTAKKRTTPKPAAKTPRFTEAPKVTPAPQPWRTATEE